MMDQFRPLLFLSLTWWIELSSKSKTIIYHSIDSIYYDNGCYVHTDSLCSLQINPTIHHVTIAIDCGSHCRLSSNFNYGQCDIFNKIGIEHCNQGRGDCRPKIYNQSACITTENAHKTETTSTTSTPDNSNIDQQSTTVTALAIIIVILIILLVIVSVALIWTCWTYKINGAIKNQYQQHR